MSARPKHPSGRPVRLVERRDERRWQVPIQGYVTPRLQDRPKDLSLVGFTARLTREDDDE